MLEEFVELYQDPGFNSLSQQDKEKVFRGYFEDNVDREFFSLPPEQQEIARTNFVREQTLPEPEPTVLGEAGKAASAIVPKWLGTLGSGVEAFGEGVSKAGAEDIGGKISDIGAGSKKYWGQKVEGLAAHPDIQGAILDKPSLAVDPKWWAYNTIDMAGSLIPTIAGYAIGGKPLSGAVGGSMEASQTWDDMRKAGVSPEKAGAAALAVGVGTGILNALGVDKMLTKRAGAGFASKVKNFLISGTWEGGTEWAEEPFVAVVEGITQGKPWQEIAQDVKKRTKEGFNVFPPSMLLGGIGGSSTRPTEKPKTAETGEKTQEASRVQQPVTSEKILSSLKESLSEGQISPDEVRANINEFAEQGVTPEQVEAVIRSFKPEQPIQQRADETTPAARRATESQFKAQQELKEQPGWMQTDKPARDDSDFLQQMQKSREYAKAKNQPGASLRFEGEFDPNQVVSGEDGLPLLFKNPILAIRYAQKNAPGAKWLKTDNGVVLIGGKKPEQKSVEATQHGKIRQQELRDVVDADPLNAVAREIQKEGGIRLTDDIKNTYSADTRNQLNKRYPGLFSNNGKIYGDEAAEKAGFESLDSFVEALKTSKTKSEIGKLAREPDLSHIDDIVKAGLEPTVDALGRPAKMRAIDLALGDEVQASGDDVPADRYTVKGIDKAGRVVLEDGVEVRVDADTELDVEGRKRSGKDFDENNLLPLRKGEEAEDPFSYEQGNIEPNEKEITGSGREAEGAVDGKSVVGAVGERPVQKPERSRAVRADDAPGKGVQGVEPWQNSDLATSPNISPSRVTAKKQADGKYGMVFIGTGNEVFPGERFSSVKEARDFFKVQQAKAQAATLSAQGASTESGLTPQGAIKAKPSPTGESATYNPFRNKAEKARKKYESMSGRTVRDDAMEKSFPLGAGFGRGTQRSRDKAIDSSVARATRIVEARREMDQLEAQADAYDRGEITAQGRRTKSEKLVVAEKELRRREKMLPIINRPDGATVITREQWNKTHADYKAISVSRDGTYRYRSMIINGALTPVFMTDAKETGLPKTKASQVNKTPESLTKQPVKESQVGSDTDQAASETLLSAPGSTTQPPTPVTDGQPVRANEKPTASVKVPSGAPVGVGAVASTPEETYPTSGEKVDGRTVRQTVPNLSSIESSIPDGEELAGVREVQMSLFTLDESPLATDARTKKLAEEIRASGEISPLIVGVDSKGPYIIEGAHRYDALKILRAKSFPAVVVIDNEAIEAKTVTAPAIKQQSSKEAEPDQQVAPSTPDDAGLKSSKPASEMTAAELLRAAADKMDGKAEKRSDAETATEDTAKQAEQTEEKAVTEKTTKSAADLSTKDDITGDKQEAITLPPGNFSREKLTITKRGRKWFEATREGKTYPVKVEINETSTGWEVGQTYPTPANIDVNSSRYGATTTIYPLSDNQERESKRVSTIPEIKKWLAFVEEKAPDYIYQNGVDKLKSLGIDDHPELQARLDAAIDSVKVAKKKAATAKDEAKKAEAAIPRIYLSVPYEDRAIAKRNGAKFDGDRSQWYVTGSVPEGLKKYGTDGPGGSGVLPDEQFRIGGGQGYGWREMHPGETMRNPRDAGPKYITIISASKKYFRDDGMSFGVGDEQGYVFSAIAREATEEESAPLRTKEAASAEKKRAKKALQGIAAEIQKDGERPDGSNVTGGTHYSDTQNIYGGGEWFTIGDEYIWYVKNNGMDGDNWSSNNVSTGGAGGIGWRVPFDEKLAERIKKESAIASPSKDASLYSHAAQTYATTPAEVEAELRKSFLGKGTDNLIKRDKLEVVRTETGLPDWIGRALKSVMHRRYKRDTPMSDWGHALFADDGDSVKHYGDFHYTVDTARLGDKLVYADSNEFTNALRSALDEYGDDYGLNSYQQDGQTREELIEALVDEANPDDIVNSAGIWDSDLVELVWNKVMEPNGWTVVKTDDGGIAFEESDINPLYSKDGTIVGAYDPKGGKDGKGGKIWLVADKIAKGQAAGVALHEVSHALLLSDEKYMAARAKIEADFERLEKIGHKAVKAAFARVPEDTPAEFRTTEGIGYFLENAANKPQPLYKRIISAIKMALMRLGIPTTRMTEADFVTLFTAGARNWARKTDQFAEAGNMVGDTVPAMLSQMAKEFGISIEEARSLKAGWTDRRVDNEIQYAAYDDGRTKAVIGFVNPQDFVLATTPSKTSAASISESAKPLDIDKMRKESQSPYLVVEEDEHIIDHEGRHRMSALAKAGVTSAPIVLDYRRPANRNDVETIELEGQSFEFGGTGKTLTVSGVIPLTFENKTRLKQLMGETDIRYSKQRTESEMKELGLRRHNGHQPLAEKLGKIIGQKVTAWRLPDAIYRQDRKGRVDTTGSPRGEHEFAGRLADIFKKRIVWVEITGGINGVVLMRDKLMRDTIFVNVFADKPAHVIFGHELSHHIEQDTPELFDALYEAIEPLIKNTETYKTTRDINLSDKGVKKEIIGDLLGDNFNNPAFWQAVEAHTEKGKFRRLIDKVVAWLDGVLAHFTDFGSSQFVDDTQEARDSLAFIVAEYGVSRREDGRWGNGEVRYSQAEIQEAAKAIYSKLEQVAASAFQGMKAQSVLNFLNKQGVKKTEIEATGLDAWIKAKKPADKVSRGELLDFVKANTVELEDVVLGGGLTADEQKERKSLIAEEQNLGREIGKIEREQDELIDDQEEVVVNGVGFAVGRSGQVLYDNKMFEYNKAEEEYVNSLGEDNIDSIQASIFREKGGAKKDHRREAEERQKTYSTERYRERFEARNKKPKKSDLFNYNIVPEKILRETLAKNELSRLLNLAQKEKDLLTRKENLIRKKTQISRKIGSFKEDDTHFSQYVEPGGVEGSYREMFVTAPPSNAEGTRSDLRKLRESFEEKYGEDFTVSMLSATEKTEYESLGRTAGRRQSTWQDGHSQYSDVKNPVIRIRFNTVEADGKKILRIEEMQGPNPDNQAKMPTHLLDNIYNLGVKRILAYAKENGFDGVALATKDNLSPGETQAARWGTERVDWKKDGDGFIVSVKEQEGGDAGGIDIEGEARRRGVLLEKKGITVTSKEELMSALKRGLREDKSQKVADAIWSRMQAEKEGTYKPRLESFKKLYDEGIIPMLEAYGKGKMEEAEVVLEKGGMRPHPDGMMVETAEERVTMPYLPISPATPSRFPMFSRQKQGPLDRYKELVKTLRDDKVDIYEKQKALETHIKKALPPVERFRVIHLIKNIAKPETKEGREKALALAIEKVEEAHEKKQSVLSKILDDKAILARRRENIKNIRDYLGLTDNDMKKVSKKDIRLMSDPEFKKFKIDLYNLAVDFAEHKQAKLELMDIIYRKQLRDVENLQKAMELPTISKMTKEQLEEFAEILDRYEIDDRFLTQRQLETVDATDLKGIKTWREAMEKLAEETGHSVEELSKIKVDGWDGFTWDTRLAMKNPFYKMMVEEIHKNLLNAQAASFGVEDRFRKLYKAAWKSRPRKLIDRLIPTDERVFDFIESGMANSEDMTPAEIDLAHFIQKYFADALTNLIETKVLEKGRENYFVHMRRSFLETWKDDGLMSAFKNMFKSQEQDQAVFEILDDDTGNILPLQKFFQFSLRRTGALTPTKNIGKAFMTYVHTFEKKKALDATFPKMMIYAQSLTPETYTPRGLETDRSLLKFTKQWLNNKKGRRLSFDGRIKQGGRLDTTIVGMRTFTTLLDLGLNIPVGVASFVGEQTTNFAMMGTKAWAKGAARMNTTKGKLFLMKYKNFTGRSMWEEFTDPGKEITERLSTGIFGLFHTASVAANKQYLLGMITDEEYNSGKISDKRLAQLKIDMGRLRMVPGTSSLVGSTSLGSAGVQYKKWAVPILGQTVEDASKLIKDIKGRKKGALSTTEAKELYRIIGLTSTVLIALSMLSGDDDDDFMGQIGSKTQRESLTLLQALDPKIWLSTPRTLKFLNDLGNNIHAVIKMEKYKTKEGYKGVEGLKRQLSPHIYKQIKKGLEE